MRAMKTENSNDRFLSNLKRHTQTKNEVHIRKTEGCHFGDQWGATLKYSDKIKINLYCLKFTLSCSISFNRDITNFFTLL